MTEIEYLRQLLHEISLDWQITQQQLADSKKREVMLRIAVEYCVAQVPEFGTVLGIEEALAATADLKDVILCHAEPVGWCGTSGVGELIVSKSKVWNFLTTPLYRAQ